MKRRAEQPSQSGTGTAAATPSPLRIRGVIAALLLLEAGALGLKAWDETRTQDRHDLLALQRESIALAERLDGQAATVISATLLGQRAGAGRELIKSAIAPMDAMLSLRDAASSPDGSRLALAADAATRAMGRNERIALSENGDVVIIIEQDAFPTSIAFAEASDWLPAAGADRRLTLVGATRFGTGNASLAEAAETAPTQSPSIQTGALRAATACSPLSGTSLRACVSRPAPLFTTAEILRWAGYGFLLVAPLLAILGLMSHLSRSQAAQGAAESDAAEARNQLDLVMSGAKAGSWSIDFADRTVQLSPMAAELMGLEETGPHSFETLFAACGASRRNEFSEAIGQAHDKGWLQVAITTEASGEKSFVELRASPSDDKPAHVLSGIVMDVTEQRRADARVRLAERRLRNAIEGVNNPFALWDQRGRLLYWNRAFSTAFDLGDTLRPGISRDTVNMARAAAIRTERTTEGLSEGLVVELYSGTWLQMVERGTAEGGTITMALDVTDAVRAQTQLERQKRKLAEVVEELERSEGHAQELARKYQEEKARAEHAANTKSAFLANMSHELRTPLNAINGFSEILVEELYGPLGDQRYKGYADDILASGQHLLDLINDILDMAKIEAGKMSVTLQLLDPVEPVDAAVRILRQKASGKKVDLVLDAPTDLPEIEADHRAIRQMVLNLVSNALKFTDEGGRITVALRVKGDDLQISVTDTGIGIPKEHISRLGRPFEQISESRDRNFEGTGLGLALTRSFAEMHGGRIGIASEVGKGTRVSIYLPLPKANADGRHQLTDLPA